VWDQTSARVVCAKQARTRHQMEPSLVKLVQKAHMELAGERQLALHVHLEHMEGARGRQLA